MNVHLAKIKGVAQAVSLAVLLSAPAAYAATINWGLHDETEFAQVVVPVAGSFLDVFQFSLSPGADITSVAVSNNLPGSFLVTEGHVDLWSIAAVSTFVATYDFSGSTGSTSHVFASLAAGDYEYRVSGIAGSQGTGLSRGLYSITSSLNPVSPIPEPEIYALMAAGLGLMGFVARRRSRA